MIMITLLVNINHQNLVVAYLKNSEKLGLLGEKNDKWVNYDIWILVWVGEPPFWSFKLPLDIIRPHRLHAVHRCGLLLQMSHVAWSVCLCLAHGWAMQKRLNRSKCGWGVCGFELPCVNHVLNSGSDPHRKWHFWAGTSAGHCYVLTHDCILHCSPAAAGKCAYPAHAAD